ncbi:MAG: hypothetical protein A2W31_11200 [Planctomycetes bacterium RBG_16_64_10]|nr:MAG: hypothetical protein A2W31_11200 [Planctomycetes bacterium RBG_16_64_10]
MNQASGDDWGAASAGRIAGIDYGPVRIGIALADPRAGIASPYESYQRRGREADAERFRRLVADERVCHFVVGVAVHASGHESRLSSAARAFGAWLEQVTGVPVSFFDERFSSAEAEQHLSAAGLTRKQRRSRLDPLAAQIMLTAYLESGGRSDEGTQPLEG